MRGFGSHPTQYQGLSSDALYAMYRQSVYSKLSEPEKLDLLQETVNRDALEQGELGSPRVEFAQMGPNVSGSAANGVILVNRDMAVNGIQTLEYQGQNIQHSIDDYNIQALNTVLHENAHCFQGQVIDGTIQIDNPQLIGEYQANYAPESAVLLNHSYHLGSQYLTGETPGGYYMYYFQAAERDAHLYAEKKTESILQGISAKYGTEPSFTAYAKSVAATGYEAMEREAAQLFQNPNFVKDVNQTLQNQYFGTNVPVQPATEKAVKAEMIESYSAAQKLAGGNHFVEKECTKMSFDYKSVSLEEYNQSLRDTVNAYYTHAMSEPSMSRDDALKSTGEMAEKYLSAVEDFQEAQATQTQVSGIADNSTGDIRETVGMTGAEVGNALSEAESMGTDTGTSPGLSEDSESIDGGEDLDDGMDP